MRLGLGFIARGRQTSGTAILCFPAGRAQLSIAGIRKLVKDRGITTHGFRSSFRDWCAEQTNCPREICEMALAHNVGSAVERAYQRSKLFRKRAELMEAWGRYCTGYWRPLSCL